MKITRLIRRAVGLLLLCAVILNIAACSMRVSATDLMNGITPNSVTELDDLTAGNANATDFALRLINAANVDGENVLLSPLSVMCALAMTANGADGETLRQMEAVLGMSVEELNLYLYSYLNSLAEGEKYKLRLANSIWFTDDERFTVNTDFLQTNADYFGADIYKTPFNRQTLRDINNWVKSETDGAIPKVLEQIPPEALMYLVNTLAFEAEWAAVYEERDMRDGIFTTEQGEKREVELMFSSLYKYLEDENATGFIKYYKERKYAFVALLPNEGVSVSDYLATLNGEKLAALIASPQSIEVKTYIPKFESEYNVQMSSVLSDMGMKDAFDYTVADFSRLGSSSEGNVYISKVIHKTYIRVDERGTKAGAVTVVEVGDATSGPPEEYKVVRLDRPFVYMLIDCENNLPFFIGTMMDVEG